MRKIGLKMLIILVIFQMLICISNINTVSAATLTDTFFSDLESQSQSFSGMGTNGVSALNISVSSLTEPLGIAYGIFYLIAIALATAKLLMTLMGIIKDDVIDKSKAKKSLTIDLIILFLVVAGIPWVKEIILMLL